MRTAVVVLALVVAAQALPKTIEFVNFKKPKIVNGGDATSGEWKWQGSLQYSDSPADTAFRHICGCCVLDANTILTAAHCVDFDDNVAHFRVVLGDHTRSTSSGNEQTLQVQQRRMHSNWNADNIENDIAILKLASNAQFTSHVQPIALPTATTDFTNQECWITGWGKTDGQADGIPDVLQEVRVSAIDNETCKSKSFVHWLYLKESMICVEGFSNAASACNGDSGGPLACKAGERWTLGGITSWGASGCPTTSPSVYTRVTSFLSWISNNRN